VSPTLYISARSAGQETENGQAKRRVAKVSTVVATFNDFMLYLFHITNPGRERVTTVLTTAIPKVMYYRLTKVAPDLVLPRASFFFLQYVAFPE